MRINPVCKAAMLLWCVFGIGFGVRAQTTLKPFSADQVLKVAGRTTTGKVYATQNAMRMENLVDGRQTISIVRSDRKVVWSLLPDRKAYIELSLQSLSDAATLQQLPGAQKLEHANLGSEQVGTHLCDKSRVQSTSNGKTSVFDEWAARDLGGFVVKRADENGKWSIEYQNVQFRDQDQSLFEIPAGYQKLDITGMGP
jgi:Domain of unknown function (DUF4412)